MKNTKLNIIKNARLEILLPKETFVKFKALATIQKTTMSEIIRYFINKEIKKHDKNKN
jgi:hypothetical protein